MAIRRSIMNSRLSGTSQWRSVSFQSTCDMPTVPALATCVICTRAGFAARMPGREPLVCVDRSTSRSRSSAAMRAAAVASSNAATTSKRDATLSKRCVHSSRCELVE
jgi:hypothetical protein